MRAPRTPPGGGRSAAGLPQVDGLLAGRPQTWVHLGVMRSHRPWRAPALQWPAGTGGFSRGSLVATRDVKRSARSWSNGWCHPYLSSGSQASSGNPRELWTRLAFQRVTTATFAPPYLALIKLPHRPLTCRVPLLHRRSAHPHRPVSPEVGDRARRLSARAGASRPLSSSRAPSTSPRRPQAARKPRARDRLALSPCDMRLHTCFAHAFAVALLRSGGASRASRRVNHLTLVSLTAAVL